MKFHVGESVAKVERKIATAGEHVVDVQAAVEEFSEFHKCNTISMQLSVVVGGFSFVFLDLTPRTTWLAGELADALGIPRIDGDVDKTLAAVLSDSDNDLLAAAVAEAVVLRSRICVIRKLSRSFRHLGSNF